ncbi:hypothetical protein SDC9_65450 [bioreactor metagenome]|uniref:Uncharacterized protein n=1 Tax=bioreactor metagenome TaxID=1076179 RepID=A0A644XS10_9ZZZZ
MNCPQIPGERHHQFLPDRIDWGIGNLCELLPEIVEQALRFPGKQRQRGVVAHGRNRLLAFVGHRDNQVLNIFFRIAKGGQ